MAKKLSTNQRKGKKERKIHNVMETRCGCEAHIYVNRGSDKKYRIASLVEQHNHGRIFLDRTSHITERAKKTLYNCHKASIGTFLAYRFLHVSEKGGGGLRMLDAH
jgi:hypothetical protein